MKSACGRRRPGNWFAVSKGMKRRLRRVGGLAFSPSGQRLASASYDRTARVWDVKTGESLQIFRGHNDIVTGVVFVGDDSQVATVSGTGDRRAVLWDVESGRPVRVFAGHTNAIFGIVYLGREAPPDAATVAGQEPGLSWSREVTIGRSGSGTWTRASRSGFWKVIWPACLALRSTRPRNRARRRRCSARATMGPCGAGTSRRCRTSTCSTCPARPGPRRSRRTAPASRWVSTMGRYACTRCRQGAWWARWKTRTTTGITRLVFDADGAVLASASHDNTRQALVGRRRRRD